MMTHTTDQSFNGQVQAVFRRFHAFSDAEVQQRAVEYSGMGRLPLATLKSVLSEMPPFPERASALERLQNSDSAASSAPPPPQPLTRAGSSLPPVMDLPVEALRVAAGSATLPAASVALDLLSQLSQPEAPPAAAAAHDPFAASGELFGAAPANADISQVTPLHDPRHLFTLLCAADSGARLAFCPALSLVYEADIILLAGVVYEDAFIQVGCRTEWRPPFGVFTLFLGNKHSATLDTVRTSVVPIPGVRIVNCGSAPATLAPQQQAQLVVEVACQQPVPLQSVPTLSLSYSRGAGTSPVIVSAKLPAVLCKFLVPAPAMENRVFYETWRSLSGPPLKLESVLNVNASLEAGGLKAWEALLAGVRLHVVSGVDPNPLNIFAASTLVTENGPSMLVIVRIESDANSRAVFRATVASPNNVVAAAVRDILTMQAS